MSLAEHNLRVGSPNTEKRLTFSMITEWSNLSVLAVTSIRMDRVDMQIMTASTSIRRTLEDSFGMTASMEDCDMAS